MKAVNLLGESDWSEYASLTTLIDREQIPRVRGLSYENSTKTLTWSVPAYPLPLQAQVQTRDPAQVWRLLRTVRRHKEPHLVLLPSHLNVQDIR